MRTLVAQIALVHLRAWLLIGLILSPTVVEAWECKFSDIVVGEEIAYGKRLSDGQWLAWGYTTADNTVVATQMTTNTFTKVVASDLLYFCGLKVGGGIVCWQQGGATTPSDSYNVIAETPAGTGYLDLAIASGTACAITSGNAIECWGKESYDPGTGACATPPHYGTQCSTSRDTITWASPSVAPSGTYLQISGGVDSVFCGIKSDTSIGCWGDKGNNYEFFNGIPAGTGWDAVSVAQGAYACAHKDSDNSITCWGYANGSPNNATLNGDPATAGAYDGANFAAFNSGGCAIKLSDQKVECWGTSFVTTDDTFQNNNPQEKLVVNRSFFCTLSKYNVPATIHKIHSVDCYGRSSPAALYDNVPVCPSPVAQVNINVIE